MKKLISVWIFVPVAAWRGWNLAALLGCALLAGASMIIAPARGADAGTDDAVLNFVAADTESVIKAVGHFTNTTFIIDPRVKGTITLVSEKHVTKAEAFRLLTSALRLQGYAVVAGDGFTKVVPEADAKLQAAPIQAGAVKGDQIATQIFRMNYESATSMVTILRPLISPNNTINADQANNSLVITDYAENLTRLGKIIAVLDAPVSGDMDVIPIRYAIATDIATMANRLLDVGGTEARTTLLVDDRTNSVILRAPSLARAALAKTLIDKLDQPTALPGNVHVVYLKNADAVKLAETLRAVVSSDSSALPSAGSTTLSATSSSANPAAPAATPAAPPAGGSATKGLNSGGKAGFIQADPATNTLIITASETVYRNLRSVIDQLDARRAQVFIESLIVEVSPSTSSNFGIQWAGLSGNANSTLRVGGLTSFSSGGNNLVALATGNGSVLPGNGLSIGLFRQNNGQLGLGAVLEAMASVADTNILSMPNLITLDNEEAKIIVGENVPFITGQFTSTASVSSGTVNPFQTIDRKDVGLTLRVKPQISEGGTVKLTIYQETSAVTDTTNPAGIITSKRSIETNVLVDDGQIIVLGGLIEDSVNNSYDKVPVLGDLPIIGSLFKYDTKSRSKTNLMVFLRPTVLRDAAQSARVTTDRYDYIRSAEVDALLPPSKRQKEAESALIPRIENGKPIGTLLITPNSDSVGASQKPAAQDPAAPRNN